LFANSGAEKEKKLARGFTLDMRTDLIHGGNARLAPRRLSQPVD
jgi:hypothetical protein